MGSPVHELAAGVGGIDMFPEHLQQPAERHARGIVDGLHRLDVAGPAGGDLLVGRIHLSPAGVAGDHLLDAVYLFQVRLDAPETSASQRRRAESAPPVAESSLANCAQAPGPNRSAERKIPVKPIPIRCLIAHLLTFRNILVTTPYHFDYRLRRLSNATPWNEDETCGFLHGGAS